MIKLIKPNTAFLACIMIAMTAPLNACGEKTMTIPRSLIYSFDHKISESFDENSDLSLDEFQPFMGGDVFFLGVALGNPNAKTFDIGVQFYTEAQERKIFVEKVYLETPELKTENSINEFVEVNKTSKNKKLNWKRILFFESISEDSIPATAEFFILKIDYKLDDDLTNQMSIRFENTSFSAPIL